MAKRTNKELLETIQKKAEEQLILEETERKRQKMAQQLKKGELNPSCRFCKRKHWTSECTLTPQEEKLSIAKATKTCVVCLGKKNHHISSCNNLRFGRHLCKHKSCGRQNLVHHTSICPMVTPEPIPIVRRGNPEYPQEAPGPSGPSSSSGPSGSSGPSEHPMKIYKTNELLNDSNPNATAEDSDE
ncbi:hypothetical protein CAEBREN_29441 [Caenorhabditis brenneri]|uniref:Uncharacterized protein n=1 Tax=Caenorhabditis brenneri TaxID=135651 RepID=G0NVM7_CAEBE|nr:hypothetical protein CAEBREN_29441 [Caenorhabditis brenneri]